MKDFIGNEIKVEDFVVMIEPAYRNLIIGKVTGLTKKRVNIKLGIQDKKTIIHPKTCVVIDTETALRNLFEKSLK